MSGLASRFARLNPFSSDPTKPSRREDEDDVGERIDANTKAGGGHPSPAQKTDISLLRVSPALRSFLVDRNVLTADQAGLAAVVGNPDEHGLTSELRELLSEPLIRVPAEVLDRSHPLPNYFISSSHNTYLMAHQLYGSASAQGYKVALEAGSRCVEIDAWDGDDPMEPKVTHGYTFTSSVPFRSVCEAIRDVVDEEAVKAQGRRYRPAPIMISLENHCAADGQLRLVQIIKEILGDRLLSKAIRDKGTAEQDGLGEHVTLAELGSKVAVIVEYHFPGEPDSDDDNDSSSSSSDEEENEEERKARLEYEKKKKETATTTIIPELAELGIYAQSVKPPNNLWFEEGQLQDSPHHPLINLSESGLKAHMHQHNEKVIRHNANHLMRVYPKGTRISSANLKPVPFWAVGAQICALNWQTFSASMQLNEALFTGTEGYVLKPRALRLGAAPPRNLTQKRLRVHIAGASDVPIPPGREADSLKPYVTCSLVHPTDLENRPPKRKTAPYKPHRLAFLHSDKDSAVTDPIWDEMLEWDFEESDLTFLRLLIKSDDAFARNPILAVAAVRLLYVQDGWRFVRLLDLKGHETACTMLVKFEVFDI